MMKYDVFISHASEDKSEIVWHLALALKNHGFRVWLDDLELTLGDSLSRSIDQGLAESRFGIVILSHAFFSKEWPKKELDALVAREGEREKVILPVRHGLTPEEVAEFSPPLADKISISTADGIPAIVESVSRAIGDAADLPQTETQPDTIKPPLSYYPQIADRLRMLADQFESAFFDLEQEVANAEHSDQEFKQFYAVFTERLNGFALQLERVPAGNDEYADKAVAELLDQQSVFLKMILWLVASNWQGTLMNASSRNARMSMVPICIKFFPRHIRHLADILAGDRKPEYVSASKCRLMLEAWARIQRDS
jgi:hypothetical protein